MSDNNHAAMCIYCGEQVIYDTRQVTDMEAAHRQLVEHDQQCPKNPLVARLEKAERIADREATGFRALCEAFERLEEIVGLDTGGGMGPGPALNAVERVFQERAAVVAHLECYMGSLSRTVDAWKKEAAEGDGIMEEHAGVMREARRLLSLQQRPAASLARLKAQWQAEGAEMVAESAWSRKHLEPFGATPQERAANLATLIANELRRQAEGDAS